MRRYWSLIPFFAVAVSGCDRSLPGAPDGPDLLRGGLPNAPFVVEWTKTETGPGTGQWRGTTQFGSQLRTRALNVQVIGSTWHLNTSWSVDLGTRSFSALLDGTLTTANGRLVLAGHAVGGVFDGARIQVTGQLTGIDATTGGTVFEGTLLVLNPFSQ